MVHPSPAAGTPTPHAMTAIPPLHQAIQSRDLEAARQALERDAAQAELDLPGGLSPLLFAMYNGAPEIAELIAGLRRTDIFDRTAMNDAAGVAAAVLEQPALLGACTPDGWTALHLAGFFGAREALFVLVGLGAPLEATAQNPTANRPLHAAIAGASGVTLAPLLLALGADPLAPAGNGITSLHLAAARGFDALCRLLVTRGVDRLARNEEGQSAGDLARERGHFALAAWLDGATN